MRKHWKQWQTWFSWAPNHDCSHEIRRHLLLGRKAVTNLDSIVKNREVTLPSKVCTVKAVVFPVVMYGCESWTINKAKHQRNDAFNCGVGENSWVPWTARRSNQLILKEINPEYSLEGLMLKLKLWYFGHLMQRATHWKRPWCWERLRTKGDKGFRGWNGWMASLMHRTWIWANSGRWWGTG